MTMKDNVRKFIFKNEFLKNIYKKVGNIKFRYRVYNKIVLPIENYKKGHEKPFFLIYTPEHANLGDHAIALSEQVLLKKIGIDYYEVTTPKLQELEQAGYLKCLDESFVMISGGGNLGQLWPEIENLNRAIVKTVLNSIVVIMPNSIYYYNDDIGKKEFVKSQEIYNSHDSLYLFARERLSYDIMKKAYRNVKLFPDMVLFFDESKNKNNYKNGCIICLREDVEKTLQPIKEKYLIEICGQMFGENVHRSNTVLDYNVSPENRKEELEKKWNEFKNVELVITDRLHGMIFCAITGTKCIVLDSRSPKMKGCYQWIRHLPYIQFVEDIEMIGDAFNKMADAPTIFENNEIMKQMKDLEKEILKLYRC